MARATARLAAVLRALSVPAGNERGPLYMDQVLAPLHQGNLRSLPVTLAVIRHMGQVTLACRFPSELQPLLEAQLYAQYPDAKLTALPDDALDPPPGRRQLDGRPDAPTRPLPDQALR